jgi:Na+-driven multidrug efflux pump
MLNFGLGLVLMATMHTFLDPSLQLFSGGKASAETLDYARDFMKIILL